MEQKRYWIYLALVKSDIPMIPFEGVDISRPRLILCGSIAAFSNLNKSPLNIIIQTVVKPEVNFVAVVMRLGR